MVQLAFIDGGGSSSGPSQKPQTHPVVAGETLGRIADHYGVTPQAIRDANPQVFRDHSPRRMDHAQETGEVIWSGDVLTIPAAAESVTRDDPLSSDYNPLYPSSNSEFSVNAQGGRGGSAITWNPGDGTVKASVNAEHAAGVEYRQTQFGIPDSQAAGVTLEAKVVGEHAQTTGFANKDGNTEISLEWDTSIIARFGGGVDGRGMYEASGERSVGAGFQSRYKVVLPGENRNPADAARINPYDPTSIPVGATVTMDSQDYTRTGMSASFAHIGTATDVKEASGTSYSVTRVDEGSVRVTMGPNQAVEAFNGVGVSTDVASAMLVRQDGLGSSKVRTATFDLTDKDGQAAYAHFTATGEIADRTPGVSDVATIERIDYSSQTRLKLGLGPEALNVQADLAGPKNTGAFVKTTYADGSYAYTTDLQYGGNVPLRVVQRFDASGNEVLSERTYAFTVNADGATAFHLNEAWSGEFRGNGPARSGKVTVTFTEQQMTDLSRQADGAVRATMVDGQTTSGSRDLALLVGGHDGMPDQSNLELAVNLARSLGSGDPHRFAETLGRISDGADGALATDGHAVPVSMEIRSG